MSRTHRHSRKWGQDHRWADRPDRRAYGGSRTGEAPGWYVRLHDERPGRHADRLIERRLQHGHADPDAALFARTGRRKPHTYFW